VAINDGGACRPSRCAVRRFARFIQTRAPAKSGGYARTVASTGVQGWEPSCDGDQTATAARPSTVDPVMPTAAIRLLMRRRRSFLAHGSQTRWPCTSDGPTWAPGAYSERPQFPHRSSRFRRADLAARTSSNETMPTGSAAMAVRKIGSIPNMMPRLETPNARTRLQRRQVRVAAKPQEFNRLFVSFSVSLGRGERMAAISRARKSNAIA